MAIVLLAYSLMEEASGGRIVAVVAAFTVVAVALCVAGFSTYYAVPESLFYRLFDVQGETFLPVSETIDRLASIANQSQEMLYLIGTIVTSLGLNTISYFLETLSAKKWRKS